MQTDLDSDRRSSLSRLFPLLYRPRPGRYSGGDNPGIQSLARYRIERQGAKVGWARAILRKDTKRAVGRLP